MVKKRKTKTKKKSEEKDEGSGTSLDDAFGDDEDVEYAPTKPRKEPKKAKKGMSIDEIEEATGVPVIGVLPDDINVQEAIANTTAVASYKPMSNASIEIRKVAAALIGQEYEDPRFMSKVKRLFSKEVRKDEINRSLLRNKEL